MAYSSSDFTSSIINHLFDSGLITPDVVDSDDLERQATATIAAINDLAQRASSQLAPATGSAAAAPPQHGAHVSAQFMDELLDAHDTLTEIGERKGIWTLADCMYMLSALQKGSMIEIHHPTGSEILDVIQALPSAGLWMTYVHEVTE